MGEIHCCWFRIQSSFGKSRFFRLHVSLFVVVVIIFIVVIIIFIVVTGVIVIVLIVSLAVVFNIIFLCVVSFVVFGVICLVFIDTILMFLSGKLFTQQFWGLVFFLSKSRMASSHITVLHKFIFLSTQKHFGFALKQKARSKKQEARRLQFFTERPFLYLVENDITVLHRNPLLLSKKVNIFPHLNSVLMDNHTTVWHRNPLFSRLQK